MRWSHRRINLFLMLLLVTLAFVIRVLYITADPIANDEPFTLFNSQKSISDLNHLFANENNPPLHFYLLHFWMKLFGASAFSVRILSVIFGSLTVIPIYKIGEEFFSRKVAIITALIFIFSNIHIQESHDARVYTILVFLVALSYYFFLRILKFPNNFWLNVGYITSLVLMLYAHYISGVVLFSQFITVLFLKKEKWKKLKTIFFLQLISVIAFLPFLKVFLYRIGQTTQNESWVPKPSIDALFIVLRQFFNQPVVAVAAIIAFVGVLIITISKKINTGEKPLVSILTWFLTPYFLVFLVSFYSSLFLAKYIMFASIGFYFIVAVFWDFIASKSKYQFVILAIPVALSAITANANISTSRRPDLLVEQVKQIMTDESIVYVCPKWEVPTFCYYYNQSIFKDYNNTEERLNEENIFFIYTSAEVEKAEVESFQKVIIVDNHNSLITETKDVFDIEQRFNLTEEIEIYPYNVYIWERK